MLISQLQDIGNDNIKIILVAALYIVIAQIPNMGLLMHFQASKNQTGRKRKQPVSSSGPANSSGTANTAGPSPSSAPSTPSTHTPGDVISMPALPHGGTSKPLIMFGTDGAGTLTSPSNQLVSKHLIFLYPKKHVHAQQTPKYVSISISCFLVGHKRPTEDM